MEAGEGPRGRQHGRARHALGESDFSKIEENINERNSKVQPPHLGRTQDGRVLRRYRRRWKVERLFAWLHNFRRVVIRWEYYPENFLGMVQLACAVILLRHL